MPLSRWSELRRLNPQPTPRGPPLVALKTSSGEPFLFQEKRMDLEQFFQRHASSPSSEAFSRVDQRTCREEAE